jgi:quercetin dioxygenase-like cupin family protein
MDVLKLNLEKITVNNKYYRKVLQTTENLQLVVMALNPGEEIKKEIHMVTTQFIKVESGYVWVSIEHEKRRLGPGDSVTIPPDREHRVWVTTRATEPAKLYTIYSPPEHPPNLRQRYRA